MISCSLTRSLHRLDICEACRNGADPLHSRKGGKHLLFHIPDSRAVADFAALDPQRAEWVHSNWSCAMCKANPISGERYYCTQCSLSMCGICVYSTNHPTNHPLQVHTKPSP